METKDNWMMSLSPLDKQTEALKTRWYLRVPHDVVTEGHIYMHMVFAKSVEEKV